MIKIKLPIEKLAEFESLSKFISTEKSKVQPILDYLKIEIEFGTCIITKTNNSSYIQYTFQVDSSEDCAFLIENDKLMKTLSLCSGEFLHLSIKPKGIIEIKDGSKLMQRYNASEYELNTYPSIPEESEKSEILDSDTINAFFDGRIYTIEDKLRPMFKYIHGKGFSMYATNRSTIYKKTFLTEKPKISITVKESELLQSFSEVQYSQVKNYNVYKINNIIYGFIIQEGAENFEHLMVTIEGYFSSVKKKDYIQIKVEDFLNFCKGAISFSGTDVCDSSINVEFGNATLSFIDKEKDEEFTMNTAVSVEGDEFDFMFNPLIWLPILKSYSYNEICISNEGSSVFVWSKNDNSYGCIISKIQPVKSL